MVRCGACGKVVSCPEHGDEYVRWFKDLAGNYVYYCSKCVIVYETVLGSVLHDHLEDYINSITNEYNVTVKKEKVIR